MTDSVIIVIDVDGIECVTTVKVDHLIVCGNSAFKFRRCNVLVNVNTSASNLPIFKNGADRYAQSVPILSF